MLALTLTLAFGLELTALVAFGLWGVHFGQGFLARSLFGSGAPLLIAVFWGAFLSPRAPVTLSPLLQLALKLVVFLLASAALLATAHPTLAAVFGIVAVVTTFGLYGFRSRLEDFHSSWPPRA